MPRNNTRENRSIRYPHILQPMYPQIRIHHTPILQFSHPSRRGWVIQSFQSLFYDFLYFGDVVLCCCVVEDGVCFSVFVEEGLELFGLGGADGELDTSGESL